MMRLRNLGVLGLAVILSVFSVSGFGGDWATYRGDYHRSGVTQESLDMPLAASWVFQAGQAPSPAWSPPAKNDYWHNIKGLNPTHTYDRVFQTVVTKGKVLFGSSSNDTLYCLDGATGRVVWTFTTEGPIRLAPSESTGRVLLGSDDGYLYCLALEDGRLLWQVRGGPSDRRFPCNGRMVSRWPVRGGVAVVDGVAYFTAGILPMYGVYLNAVDVQSGKKVWTEALDVSSQGHIAATSSRLFLSTGRTGPAVFERATGRKVSDSMAGSIFGCYTVLLEDAVVQAGDEKGQIQISDASGGEKIVTMSGYRLIANGGMAYVLDRDGLFALDRLRYLATSRKINAIERVKSADRTEAQKKELDALRGERKACVKWKVPCNASFELILAGDVLFVGGSDEVLGFSVETGKQVLVKEVEGDVYGLAVADGMLVASTSAGRLYSFSEKGRKASGKVVKPVYFAFDLSQEKSTEIVDSMKDVIDARRGYCLVIGDKDGTFAYSVAAESEMQTILLLEDGERASELRTRFAESPLYGKRFVVHTGDIGRFSYPGRSMNVIVVDERGNGSYDVDEKGLKGLLAPLNADYVRINAGSDLGDSVNVRVSFVNVDSKGAQLEADWTHWHGGPSGDASSSELAVNGELEPQWLGDPGPSRMADRHHRNVPPLYSQGRMFVPGDCIYYAVDAYNGAPLWQVEVPNSRRLGVFLDTSNIVVDDDYFYVAAVDKCFGFDVNSGENSVTRSVPQDCGDGLEWGYVARVNGLLLGSACLPAAAYDRMSNAADKELWYQNMKVVTSRSLFALKADSGKETWTYKSGVILNSTIVVYDGRLYFVETDSPKALGDKLGRMPIKHLFDSGEQRLVALDVNTGKVAFKKVLDVSKFEEPVVLNAAKGLVLVSGSQLLENRNVRYSYQALQASDGELQWKTGHDSGLASDGGHGEYNRHPTIVGDAVYAWPYKYDILTGKRDPDWKFDRRGHGCGGVSASANALFWRGHNPWMYDLEKGEARRLAGRSIMRPGCWINMIPAGGLLMMPEASSGCTCGYSVQASIVFAPKESL